MPAKILVVALTLLAACAGTSLPVASVASTETFPRHGICKRFVERGYSAGQAGPGVECIPPRSSPEISARHNYELGDRAGAGDCMVTAFEQRPERAELAFNAAQLYRQANLHRLARTYFARFVAVAPDHPRAGEARRWLAELAP